MVEPVSAASPVSAQESGRAILSSSHVESKVGNNNSNHETREVKKKNQYIDNTSELSKEAVERTVQALKDYVESNKRSLKIEVHQGTGVITVKVISEKDGKVIREISPEKLIDLAVKMEELPGTLFNENA